jgi:CheY-like chemotaxis protein
MDHTPEIFLIEDNQDDRELFTMALAASGLEARLTYAENAAEAVMRLNRIGEFAQVPLPSLVILDLGLPGLQGKTLLQVIRNAYGPRTIPVVVLTGSVSAVDRAECEIWGISEYMVKPRTYVEQIRLVASLQRFLSHNRVDPDATPIQSPILREGARPRIPGTG